MGTTCKLELKRLPSGDIVYLYSQSIVVVFWGKRRVLSTSVYNGGYREDLEAVFNQDGTSGPPAYRYEMLSDDYWMHLRLTAKQLGLDPNLVSGMSTAAQMENVSIQTLSHNGVTVTAIVTGGIGNNGGRVGDPAEYDELVETETKLGTINIMLLFNVNLPAATMARALVTCTEAKTAALQELMAGSCYSSGIATGSGTDQTMIVAVPDASVTIEDVGKHSKYGELIGKVVKAAVKEALGKQYPYLTVKNQHDALARLKRYNITEDSIWQVFAEKYTDKSEPVDREIFVKQLRRLAKIPEIVTTTVLYVHLYDELEWGLLDYSEVREAGEELLNELAYKYAVSQEIPQNTNGKLLGEMESLLALIVRESICAR